MRGSILIQFLLIASFFLGSLWMGCSGVTTTTTENSVFGKVLNKEGMPAKNAPVSLYRKTEGRWNPVRNSKSNEDARYEFNGLEEGSYQVVVNIDGEEGVISDEIDLVDGEREFVPVKIEVFVTVVIEIKEIKITELTLSDGYFIQTNKEGFLEILGASRGLDTLEVQRENGELVYVELNLEETEPVLREVFPQNSSSALLASSQSSSITSSSSETSKKNESSSSQLSSSLSSSSLFSSSSEEIVVDTVAVNQYAQMLLHLPLDGSWNNSLGENVADSVWEEPVFENLPSPIHKTTAFFAPEVDSLGNEYVEILYPDEYRTGFPFSVSGWIRPTVPVDGGDFFTTSYQNEEYTGYRGFRAAITADLRLEACYGLGVVGSNGRRSAYSTNALSEGVFNHVVYIFKGVDDFELWINGVKEETLTYSGLAGQEVVHGGGNALIAGHGRIEKYKASFKGHLSDLRVFRGALHEDQVLNLYQNK